jgi:regulator of protease activity HflC (stomatin/prohibitin superfamily)
MDEPKRAQPAGIAAYLRERLRHFNDDLMLAALVLIVLLLFLLPSMVVTIPAGHVGVLWKRFAGGTVTSHIIEEGTSLILPWDQIFVYDGRLQSVDREFEVLSSDGLKIKVDLAWRYRVNHASIAKLHQYAGPDFAETLLAPSVGSRARDVFAIYRPEEIYTAHRLEIQNQISESVRYDLLHRFNPPGATEIQWVVIEDVLVKRIVLPPGVEDSIVRKNVARHEVEQYALIVEKEQKETERKRIEATGIRNFQEIVSNGMNEAYLRWRGIEATLELARSTNAKVVIIGNNKTGGLPIISISGDGKGDDASAKPPSRPALASGQAAAEASQTPALQPGRTEALSPRTTGDRKVLSPKSDAGKVSDVSSMERRPPAERGNFTTESKSR